MVSVAVSTVTVKTLGAEEASALTRLQFAALLGLESLTGVTTCSVRAMINAKAAFAIMVHAVIQAITVVSGGKIIRQTGVPTFLATKVKTNAEVTWNAWATMETFSACSLTRKQSPFLTWA